MIRCPLCILFVLLLSFPSNAQTTRDKNRPLFEGGLGIGSFYLPDYPASDQYRLRWVPFPYAIYRGKQLRADREGGIRTRLLRGLKYEVDFSFSGSFPAESEDNKAREGMSDLDWMFEIGPQLRLMLTDRASDFRWELRFPLRAVFSTDLTSVVDRGITFNPEMSWRWYNVPYDRAVFTLDLSSRFTTARSAEYFFEVKPKYALATRPAYEAEPGYLNSSFSIGQTLPWRQFNFFTGYTLSYYGGSVNARSPLHRSDWNHFFYVSIIWTFYYTEQSSEVPTTVP